MIKKIDILGMHIDNYTVREAILQLDLYMNNTFLNIIETVTMKQLMLAGENARVRECLESADLSIIGEREILSETGNASAQRMREIRDNDFMKELLKRAVRNQKRVYLIAMTREELTHMQEVFARQIPQFEPVGSYAVGECVGDLENVVNEINGATPDFVISGMTSPFEEEFILDHKDKIGASVWYGVGNSYADRSGMQVGHSFKRLLLRGRLRHSVSRYESRHK